MTAGRRLHAEEPHTDADLVGRLLAALSVSLVALPYYRDTLPALVASSRHVLAQLHADGTG